MGGVRIWQGIFLFHLLLSLCWAGPEGSLAPAGRKEELRLRVDTILLQLTEEGAQAEASGKPLGEAQWINQIRRAADLSAAAYERAGLEAQELSTLRQFLSQISPQGIYRLGQRITESFLHGAKKYGLPFVISQIVGMVIRVGVPIALGHPELILPSFMSPLPIGETIWVGWMGVDYLRVRRNLARIYGGWGKLHEVDRAVASAQQELRMRTASDIIAPAFRARGKLHAISVSNPGLLRRVAEALHVVPRSFNFNNLVQFAEKNGLLTPGSRLATIVRGMKADTETPVQLKTIVLLYQLPLNKANLRKSFVKDFGQSLSTRRGGPPANAQALREWADFVVDAPSIDGLPARIAQAPRDVPAHVIARIYRDALLPALEEKLDVSPADLRRLREQAVGFVAHARTAGDEPWSRKWQNAFEDYLRSALKYPCAGIQKLAKGS